MLGSLFPSGGGCRASCTQAVHLLQIAAILSDISPVSVRVGVGSSQHSSSATAVGQVCQCCTTAADTSATQQTYDVNGFPVGCCDSRAALCISNSKVSQALVRLCCCCATCRQIRTHQSAYVCERQLLWRTGLQVQQAQLLRAWLLMPGQVTRAIAAPSQLPIDSEGFKFALIQLKSVPELKSPRRGNNVGFPRRRLSWQLPRTDSISSVNGIKVYSQRSVRLTRLHLFSQPGKLLLTTRTFDE